MEEKDWGRMKRYREKIRRHVIKHYSNGKMCCACCGENLYEFLCIDHIAGGGNKHRGEIKRGTGCAFYVWLKKNHYPEGYRVLCYNCNSSLGHYGYCPHQNKEDKYNSIREYMKGKILNCIEQYEIAVDATPGDKEELKQALSKDIVYLRVGD